MKKQKAKVPKTPATYIEKLKSMSTWADIYSFGFPSAEIPVEIYCEWAQNPACRMYVGKRFGKWQIDYTTDPNVEIRMEMERTKKVASDKKMFLQVVGLLETFAETLPKEKTEEGTKETEKIPVTENTENP